MKSIFTKYRLQMIKEESQSDSINDEVEVREDVQ